MESSNIKLLATVEIQFIDLCSNESQNYSSFWTLVHTTTLITYPFVWWQHRQPSSPHPRISGGCKIVWHLRIHWVSSNTERSTKEILDILITIMCIHLVWIIFHYLSKDSRLFCQMSTETGIHNSILHRCIQRANSTIKQSKLMQVAEPHPERQMWQFPVIPLEASGHSSS